MRVPAWLWLSQGPKSVSPELLRRQLPWQIAACHFRRLYLVTDRLDDLRIGEGRDIPGAGEVRDPGYHTPHDLSGTGLRHVRNDPHVLWSGNLPDDRFDGAADAILSLLTRRIAGLQGNVHLDGSASELVHHGYRRRLGDL